MQRANLAGADLSAYSVFVVPSLADGPDLQPYALLRNGTIAARLHDSFMGRVAAWSGTPDVGSTNRAAKDNLLRNLAGWAKPDSAGTHGPGVVALQDNSDDPAARYGWLGGISQLSLTADNTLDVYVARIRRKLRRMPAAPKIKTVHGLGYRLQ